MARFRWTEENCAELRRLMNYDLPYEEIGKRLGCSLNAARSKAYKMGWSGHGRSGRIRGDRQKGKKRSADTIAKMRAIAKRAWADPDYRQKMVAGIGSAAAKAARNAKIARAYAVRRGFAIPADKIEDYRFLIHRKKFCAQEAGAILGLIPQTERSA